MIFEHPKMPHHHPKHIGWLLITSGIETGRDIEEKETNIPNLEQRLLAQQSAAGSKKGEKKKDAQ